MKTQTEIALNRINRAKQNRYNPPPIITDPAQVARKLDSFEVGYLKNAVNIVKSLQYSG